MTVVAVEADWPDAAVIDRHVRHRPVAEAAEPLFRRLPTWMWRNAQVDAFLRWLTDWNAGLPQWSRTGFHGLDLYNLFASIEAVLDYLDRVDPEAAATARERYGCLTPWAREPQTYGRIALNRGYRACEASVSAMLKELLERGRDYAADDGDRFLEATGAARLV